MRTIGSGMSVVEMPELSAIQRFAEQHAKY